MPRMTFHFNGEVREVDGTVGESVMRAATRAGIPGVVGECGGELSCATCHVVIRSEHAGAFPPASRDEDELLDVLDEREDGSRLSCQLKLTDEVDGLILDVPAMA